MSEPTRPAVPEAEPPKGAIPAGDGVYMVPSERDESGCMAYRAWSASGPVLTVIYYRTHDGRFTADRSQADCGS